MRFFVAGLVRNCEKILVNELQKLISCFDFGEVKFFIVESDSSDRTVSILKDFRRVTSNFDFVSLGHLVKSMPERVERITFCRNQYLAKFYEEQNSYDYLVVADLDGVNPLLNQESIQKAMQFADWSMISANQKGPYYDLWALRAKKWHESDSHLVFEKDFEDGNHVRKSYFNNFIKPMFKYKRLERIQVSSAFGGFAIYKAKELNNFFYSEFNEAGLMQCEHVNFNNQLHQAGGKLFIATNLYNAFFTRNAQRAILRFFGILIFGKKYFSLFRKDFH